MAYRLWTEAENQILREQYAESLNDDLAEQLGRSRKAVQKQAHNLGLKKSMAFMQSQKMRFSNGQIPWCKGIKFKRKNPSKSRKGRDGKPVGTVVTRPNGLVFIKVAKPRFWMLLYRKLWIDRNGPIPKGHVLQAIDGNKNNTSPENWRCVHRNELLQKVSSTAFGPEVHQSYKLLKKLKRTITEIEEKRP